MRRVLYVLARLVLAGFCWLTAMYAFVASSPFAHQQFIKPRVFRWVGQFADWHPLFSWLWVALLLATLWVNRRRRARSLALLLALCAVAWAAWNTVRPLVPSLVDGPGSVAAGLAVLTPIAWLAVIDHVASFAWLRTPRPSLSLPARRETEGRFLVASLAAALLVAVTYTALTSIGLTRAFEPDLMGARIWGVAGIAVADLLFVFAAAYVLLVLPGRLFGRWHLLHYGVLLALLALACSTAVSMLAGTALGVNAVTARLMGMAMGVSAAGTWGGLRVRHLAASRRPVTDATDILLPQHDPAAGTGATALGCATVVVLAFLLAALSRRMDWDFVLLKAGVLIVWAAAFLVVCGTTPLRAVSTGTTAAACALPLLLQMLIAPGAATRHALDRYAVYNPSFLVGDAVVRPQPQAPSFDRYLRANTGLTDVPVAPVPIDLVPPPLPAASRTPLILLLVIDSLRPDYLSPYNPAVHFTPSIQAFADSNLVFTNAFTRYGGTGLAMPAIWAGSALPHKQYVLPFSSMNALEKVLDRNGYQRMMSRDHIADALWQRQSADRDLDRGRTEMDFEFCQTLDEAGSALASGNASGAPLFVQTRSLNLHVAAVRNGYVPPGKTYDGFEPPYAWRVEQMDSCFGAFVDRLKRLGVYDESLIVLTADHGELIGEDGRWGHSYHMFPQVVQTPLLIHLPASVPQGFVDTGAVSLSTDIVPTIYRALGYRPGHEDSLTGRSLIESDDETSTARRQESVVLAASYGAVYAVVSDNGRHLYIADAIKGVDLAYRRTAGRTWTEVAVDAGQREAGQRHIRRYVDDVARRYSVWQLF